MAGIAHLGVGLASKRIVPKVPLGVLLIGAYTIDIIWGIFFLAGVEHFPQPGLVSSAPWSHGLFMSVIWSAIAALATAFISRNFRTSIFMGLLVFSHWVVDFIAKPMLATFPTDSGLPLFFDGSPTVGLGLYKTQIGITIGEYGTLVLGMVIYVMYIVKKRRTAEGKKLNLMNENKNF